MKRVKSMIMLVAGGVAVLAAAYATGQPSKEHSPASPQPGGNHADIARACAEAGTPGAMHRRLARMVGEWHGSTRMWMSPGGESLTGECVWHVTSVMDGRYIRCEMIGEMPGLGEYRGLGYSGFDNVSGEFVGTWIDNHGTGIMNGAGGLSDDGRTMRWSYSYNCPIRRKPMTVRQVETFPDDDTMSFEMFTTDPASGAEYRCMHIDFRRQK
ncbi:MAG: DUF1579 domain-containing protein [Phycisphaerales bacterium]|nr:DUF1579 domain-containing protein [Phycisphaerales bacterium]